MRWGNKQQGAGPAGTAIASSRLVGTTDSDTELAFDLNIGEVLEHWTVAFASADYRERA